MYTLVEVMPPPPPQPITVTMRGLPPSVKHVPGAKDSEVGAPLQPWLIDGPPQHHPHPPPPFPCRMLLCVHLSTIQWVRQRDKMEEEKAGAEELVFTDEDGNVCEGLQTNFFIVMHDRVRR